MSKEPTLTCQQGYKHRWDESRSRCLDCGRDAATIAEELEDWLGQTEDARDRDADHLAEAHDLLERAEALMLAPHGDFSGWLSDYAAFAEKYPQEDEDEE